MSGSVKDHKVAVSGHRNNCGLHACVPAIIDVVGSLASNTPDERILPYADAWEKLKKEFIGYYGLSQDLSWTSLHAFLTETVPGSIEQQRVLGPVLRRLIDSNESSEMLHSTQLAKLTQPLGFRLITAEKHSQQLPEMSSDTIGDDISPTYEPIGSISLFLVKSEAHWKLTSFEEPNLSATFVDSSKISKEAVKASFEAQKTSDDADAMEVEGDLDQVDLLPQVSLDTNKKLFDSFDQLKGYLFKGYPSLFGVTAQDIAKMEEILNTAEAEGETDEAFARRLQTGENNFAKLKF